MKRINIQLAIVFCAIGSVLVFQNFVKVDPKTVMKAKPIADDYTLMVEYSVMDAAVPGKEEVPSFRRVRTSITDNYLHSFSFNYEPDFGGFTERIGNNCGNTPKNNPTFVEMWFKSPKDKSLKTCEYRVSANEDYKPCTKGTINLIEGGQLITINTDGEEASEINKELCPDVFDQAMNAGDVRYLEFKLVEKNTNRELFRKFSYTKQ